VRDVAITKKLSQLTRIRFWHVINVNSLKTLPNMSYLDKA